MATTGIRHIVVEMIGNEAGLRPQPLSRWPGMCHSFYSGGIVQKKYSQYYTQKFLSFYLRFWKIFVWDFISAIEPIKKYAFIIINLIFFLFKFNSPSHSSAAVVSNSAPKNYAHSAPAKQVEASSAGGGGWSVSAYEVLSFLNLRGILRRETPITNNGPGGSESNSEAGTPPNKDALSFSATPPSQTSISMVEHQHNQTGTSVSSTSAVVAASQRFGGSRMSSSNNGAPHESTPMLADENNDPRNVVGDPSSGVIPKYGHGTKIMTCHCPPDADFSYLNLKDFRYVLLWEAQTNTNWYKMSN